MLGLINNARSKYNTNSFLKEYDRNAGALKKSLSKHQCNVAIFRNRNMYVQFDMKETLTL